MKHHIFYIPSPELGTNGCLHRSCADVVYDRTITGEDWWAPKYADRRVAELKSRKGVIAAWHQTSWYEGAFT